MKQIVTGASIALKNVLFATDFSHRSELALPYALSIARNYGSKLIVGHVLAESLGFPTSVREGLTAIGAVAKRETPSGLMAIEKRLAHVPHAVETRSGDVWTELAGIICARNIDLIVIGTHGRTGARKVLVGSVAEQIFRHSPCPVLTIGPQVAGEPESIADLHEILYATDFSDESLAALPYAVSLAQHDRARLYLLHISSELLSLETEKVVVERLLEMVPDTAELACKPKALVEFGPPAEKILEVAEELGTDLIVLGVKRTPIRFELSPHLPQPTAYKVVSHATCPVLTVRG